MKRYYPKRPVKSFQDLEVYQKTLGLAVEIVKRVAPLPELPEVASRPAAEIGADVVKAGNKSQKRPRAKRQDKIGTETACSGIKHTITKKLIHCVLAIPLQIATAHSVRFGDSERAIASLEEAMLSCNLAVVYLEKFRDLVNQKIEAEYFEEQIKEYLRVRGKIMRLQKSWIKFMRPKEEKNVR